MSASLETLYASLNAKQKEVVDALYGSYMVVAGPGTGKTQVLAARTAKILESTDVLPENILITTFTEAGVIALKKRLLSFIGPASYKVRVTTIHGFAKDVIESYPEYFLKYRAFTLMDELENYELVESILSKGEFPQLFNVNQPTYWIPDSVKRIKNLRDEAVTPTGFLEHIAGLHVQFERELSEINPERAKKTYANAQLKHEKVLAQMNELQRIYVEYDRIKRERGKYDFSDMILYVAQEITENDLLASQLSEQYQFVMVDEFQDLSNAQNNVIMGLLRMSDTPNILTVGDDDQSIYRFQGANLENMLHFSQKFEDTRIIVLDTNYRSGQGILDVARSLIENNSTRITKLIPSLSKPLQSGTGKASQVRVVNYPNPESEQARIVERIQELQANGTPLPEIAILARKNAEVAVWTEVLESHGIPVTSRQKYNLFQTEEFRLVQYLIEMVALAKVPDYSLIELLRIGLFGSDRIGLYRIAKELEYLNYRRTNKLSFFDMLLYPETLEAIVPDTVKDWAAIGQKILKLRSLPQSDVISVLRTILSELDIEAFVQKRSGIVGISRIYKILEEIRSLVQGGRVDTLREVIDLWKRMENYRITFEVPDLDSKTKGVQILTAHQSKGLEYECVFVPGTLNGVWGNTRNMDKLLLPESITGAALEKSEKNEEERRLYFVALTRAKSILEVSFPASARGAAKLPSEFLDEMGTEREDGKEIENYLIVPEKASGMFQLEFNARDLTYLREVLAGYKLSPTDLNTFIEDPKQFLKKSLLKYPFEDNPYFIFGRSYHEALEKFFLEWKKDEGKPSFESLLENFTTSISRAYLSPAELADAKKRGEAGLRGWYDLQPSDMLPPAALEYSFSARNILFENIPLKGKIDRIDLLENGTLRVIDFKTGNPKSQNELQGEGVNGDRGYYRQLMFYRLMLSLDSNWSKYPVDELRVDFVEGKNGDYRTVSLPIDHEQEELLTEEIRNAWKCISSPEWWAEYLQTEHPGA